MLVATTVTLNSGYIDGAVITPTAGSNNVDFATQAATGGPIVRFSNYQSTTGFTTATAGVFKITAPIPLTQPITINGLILVGSGSELTLTGSSANTLTFSSGSTLYSGSLGTSGANIISTLDNFGASTQDGLILSSQLGFASNFANNISGGSGGLTIGGPGTTILPAAFTNNYLGTTTINGGIVQLGNASSLGNGTQTITLNNGTLQIVASLTVNNTTTNIAGPVAIDTNPIGGAGALTLTFDTALVGSTPSAALAKINPGTLTLASTEVSTFTGPTFINAGVLSLARSAASAGIAGPVTVGFTQTLGTLTTGELFFSGSNAMFSAGTNVTVNNDGLVALALRR